jgi:hypothetical protein
LPEVRESAAIAPEMPKLAALFYDRVWAGLNEEVPADVNFCGGTETELRFEVMLTAYRSVSARLDGSAREVFTERGYQLFGEVTSVDSPSSLPSLWEPYSRRVAEAIAAEHQVSPTPVFSSVSAQQRVYQPGAYDVIVGSLTQVPVITDAELRWEQVLEVRHDQVARRKLRRFVHWLDKEMIGKSTSFIADEIAERLEDYQRTLTKHGLRTVIGTVSAVLDSKVLLGGGAAIASLSFAREPFAALIAGGAIVLGSAAVHVARSLLDLEDARQTSNAQIAFISEIARTNQT